MRYKEFNPNSVLEKCVPMFWKTGFRGTSINDIVNLTRVNRFSLYDEFGSKEGLLLAAMKLYNDRYVWGHVQILKQKGEIASLLEEFYMSFLKDQKQEGCFIVHVGIELADTDQDVKVFLEGFMNGIETHIVQLLEREYDVEQARIYGRHLVGLFYTSMSFCLIQSNKYRAQHIRNGISVILNKEINHA